jgi:hypothetical protein
MDDEIFTFTIGVIILILIINTTAILSIASTVYGQDSASRMSGTTGSSNTIPSTSPEVTQAASTLKITKTPAPTPQVPVAAAGNSTLASVSGSAANRIFSYVTIEPQLPQPIETHETIEPAITDRSNNDFITIYSINNQRLMQSFPNVSFDLRSPPLIIEYSVEPLNITDLKYVEYKSGSKMYKETINLTRPYEGTWFTVVARDKDTGEIIYEDGMGRTRSLISPKQLDIRKTGNFQFEFDGEFGYLNLTMKVKKEGNIP